MILGGAKMPIIKIHISSTIMPFQKPILVKEVRKSLSEILGIDEKIGHVILYESLPQFRSAHESRSNNFVFAEISMYSGRSAEIKKTLLKKINTLISKYLEIDEKDINCCIVEIPKENWYGGQSHD
jgi:phenylpyruvate tautomerase PptA (4-oxalocrotonate tautomerase family)